MRLLLVIGAGASFDCWPEHVVASMNHQRIPLASNLFAPEPVQNAFLNNYHLMGLASAMRRKARVQGDKFDVEAELAKINDSANKRGDFNDIQNLFKARFYLHGIINVLSKRTMQYTNAHTIYVDLLNQLKEWIDKNPRKHFVDIVVFNYDDLIEKAMENVYNYDWYSKNKHTPLQAYYGGTNLKIYKPHGSINWGRKVEKNDFDFHYNSPEQAFHDFNQIDILDNFEFVDPDIFTENNESKSCIPSIAVPFKGKTNFAECPRPMHQQMVEAIRDADKLITIGWKGADEHFTTLLEKENEKIDEVHIVSPKADTQLDNIFPSSVLKPWESTFRYFTSDSPTLETILQGFDSE